MRQVLKNSIINLHLTTKAPSILFLVSVSLYFIFSLFKGTHGYSLPIWHAYLDGSTPSEIINGEAQAIRSDDWALDLVQILAQDSHRPSFPTLNSNVGSGLETALPLKVPAINWTTLFRQPWPSLSRHKERSPEPEDPTLRQMPQGFRERADKEEEDHRPAGQSHGSPPADPPIDGC